MAEPTTNWERPDTTADRAERFWRQVWKYVERGGEVPSEFYTWVLGSEYLMSWVKVTVEDAFAAARAAESYLNVEEGHTRCPECQALVRVQVMRGGKCQVIQTDGRLHLCPTWASPNALEEHQRTPPVAGLRPNPPAPRARPPLSVEPPSL